MNIQTLPELAVAEPAGVKRRKKKKTEMETVGNVTIPIYPTPSGKYPAWTVVHTFAGKRIRQKFSDLGLAHAEAKAIAGRLSNGQTAVLSMTSADQASFARCQEIARTIGKPIEMIVLDYADNLRDVDVPLSELKRFYKQHHPAGIKPLKVPDLVKQFLEVKREQNLSDVHRQDLETRCNRFAKTFKCPLTEITRQDFTAWLRGLKDERTQEKLGPRSRNNYRAAVLNLVQYAKDSKVIPKDWEPLEDLPIATAAREEIEIWTPAQMRTLLDGAQKAHREKKLQFDLIPYLAIGAFAGPRQAELCRIEWRKNVKLHDDRIVLGAEITKTDTGRQTPILPNLARWLRPYSGCFGPVCQFKNVSNALVKLANYVGIEWRHNALRHSFITYRVAMTKDVPRTALEAGNSVRQIHDSYLEFSTTEDEARAWFNILPAEAEQKILSLDFGG